MNSILPSHMNTPATDGNFAGNRFGDPEHTAPVAVFPTSDDADWVTGESIRAAGGMRGVGYRPQGV